ncbi:MAG TPA: hypothetical protein VFU88_22740 [Ktedonobacterales bacterium]|nr:hypothetical protein [Ktedonobacterales bacterium]
MLPAPAPASPPVARRRVRHWRIIASCLALVVVMLANVKVASNHRFYDMLSAPTDGLFRVHICETLGRVPEVLFMGSSRTQHGIDAPLMDRLLAQQLGHPVLTCNSGDDGSNFEHDYYMLDRYIGDGFIPRLIVENLWEYNLTSHADEYNIPNADMPWLAGLGDGWDMMQHQNAPGDIASYGGFLIQKLVPLYGDRIGLLKRLCGALPPAANVGPCAADLGGKTLQEVNANGYAFNQGYQPITDRTLVQLWPIVQQKAPPCSPHCNPLTITSTQTVWLQKMIALAHRHGIRVVLNITPLSEKQFLYFAPGDWTHIHAYFQGIADISGAYFSDDSRLPGYTDLDFWDTHHLSAAGATKYTTWLASNIVAPVLTGKLSVPSH